jgi:small subunit ribosomal protein S19
MTRSKKKGFFIEHNLLQKVILSRKNNSFRPIKTWSRSSIIIPEMVGQTISVHNGKVHLPIVITDNMIGYKLGEFAPTRTFRGHTNKTKR